MEISEAREIAIIGRTRQGAGYQFDGPEFIDLSVGCYQVEQPIGPAILLEVHAAPFGFRSGFDNLRLGRDNGKMNDFGSYRGCVDRTG